MMDRWDILPHDPVTFFSPMTIRVSVQSVAAQGQRGKDIWMALVSDAFILIRISFPKEITMLNSEVLQTKEAQVKPTTMASGSQYYTRITAHHAWNECPLFILKVMHPNTKSISENGRFLWHVIIGSSAQSDLVCTQMGIDINNYLTLITQHIQNQSGSVNKSVSFYGRIQEFVGIYLRADT